MCNYGKSPGNQDWRQVLEELDEIVKKLPWEFEDFLLTPSGSMLDEREVPEEMRSGLAEMLKRVRTKRFIIETRADSITDEGLDFMQLIMPETDKYIEIGVESSNDWVLKNCVNKGMVFETFRTAVERIHQKGLFVTANVGLGQPFLSERASVEDAIRTIKDAFEAGCDSVVLFPYHIKEGTLLSSMHDQGMYDCVSLWSLVAVLDSFSEKDLDKIHISWYKDYFGQERSFILQSPDTCGNCRTYVMKKLDRYRDLQDPEIIRTLSRKNCVCKDVWREKLNKQCPYPDWSGVEQMYHKLASVFQIEEALLEKQLETMEQEYKEKVLR